MTEKNTPEMPEKKLTGNKELLATAVVALVVWVLVRNALKKKESIQKEDIHTAVMQEVAPMVESLPDPLVDHFVNAKNDRGQKRRFLERVLDAILWAKR